MNMKLNILFKWYLKWLITSGLAKGKSYKKYKTIIFIIFDKLLKVDLGFQIAQVDAQHLDQKISANLQNLEQKSAESEKRQGIKADVFFKL